MGEAGTNLSAMHEPTARKREGSPTPPRGVRDDWDAVLAARRRPMAARLDHALRWNALAAELRSGLARAKRRGA